MVKSNKSNTKPTSRKKFILAIIIILVLYIVYYNWRHMSIDEYCSNSADKIINSNGTRNQNFVPNDEEMRRYGFKKTDKISSHYREYLKCGDKQKLFYIF